MSSSQKSRAWFSGRYFALRQLTGVEVLPTRHTARVQVSRTVLHGTPRELRNLAANLVRAAELAEAGASS